MSLTLDQLATEAMGLPTASRAALAEKLIGSLDAASDAEIQQVWVAEAIRRRDDVRSGRVKTIPGDEALARVRRSMA